MDWSNCPLVERDPFKLGGVPILKGTRMQADSIVENYEDGSPVEEISYNFSIPAETIRRSGIRASETGTYSSVR